MTPLSILYVDDDPDIRVIVGMALSLDGGIALSSAASAAEALTMVATGFTPDAALVDVMMPDMDGPTLLDRLRAIPAMAGVPIIFVTAKARAADVAMYRTRGAAGVIVKPFNPLTLAADVRAICAAAAP